MDDKTTEITCAIAFDYIRQECVTYNPANRYRISPDTWDHNSKTVKEYGPKYPQDIDQHIKSCEFCKKLEHHLSQLNLPDGTLSIVLKVQGMEGVFRGTPDEIVDGLGVYLLPSSEIQTKGSTIKIKLLGYLTRMIGPSLNSLIDPTTGTVSSIDLITECIRKRALAIEADPWFILSTRPADLIP